METQCTYCSIPSTLTVPFGQTIGILGNVPLGTVLSAGTSLHFASEVPDTCQGTDVCSTGCTVSSGFCVPLGDQNTSLEPQGSSEGGNGALYGVIGGISVGCALLLLVVILLIKYRKHKQVAEQVSDDINSIVNEHAWGPSDFYEHPTTETKDVPTFRDRIYEELSPRETDADYEVPQQQDGYIDVEDEQEVYDMASSNPDTYDKAVHKPEAGTYDVASSIPQTETYDMASSTPQTETYDMASSTPQTETYDVASEDTAEGEGIYDQRTMLNNAYCIAEE